MDSGALVPDQIIIEMMIGEIKKTPAAGCILDGFPRTLKQARELDKALAANGQKVDAVLNLVIDDQVVAGRMTGRRSCPKCGAVYHVENLKPKTPDVCDHDGVKLVQRPDDAPPVVANRLQTYHRQTEPLVEYYINNGLVFDLDADRDPNEIKALIFDKLDGLAAGVKRVSAKRSTT
jgi:adenylate kinase